MLKAISLTFAAVTLMMSVGCASSTEPDESVADISTEQAEGANVAGGRGTKTLYVAPGTSATCDASSCQVVSSSSGNTLGYIGGGQSFYNGEP